MKQTNQLETAMLPGIKAQSRPYYIPLSFSQERLWFIHQLKGSLQYHVPEVLRLRGDLNKEALVEALRGTVERHEALRTVFLESEGQPYQFINTSIDWKLSFIDGRQYKQDVASLETCIRRVISKPFDLSKDYMLRASLISIDDQEHVLVLTVHHIASDGWSMSIIVKEIAELYEAYIENQEADVVALPIQYPDYSIWQRNYLQGEILDKKIAYWKQKLDGVTALQLPTDRHRPAVRSIYGTSMQFNISKDLSAQLRALSLQQGTTLYMTLLAAIKVLLFRYSGQRDICVGAPVSNRMQKELDGSVGFFVNTLALRTEVDGEAAFSELLKQVKINTLEAFENQEVPFEKVMDVVLKERYLSRNPLFQVMFVLQSIPEVEAQRLGEMTLSAYEYEHTPAQFGITFTIKEKTDGLQVLAEYSTDLYYESTIARMLNHFKILLISILKAPNQKIGQLPMLTTEEEHEMLNKFNQSAVEYSKDKTILDLFQEQAARTPKSVAVIFEEQQLRYEELNGKANQLALELLSSGIGENQFVPILMPEGIDYLVSFIAILKTGAACVPLGIDWPRQRIETVLQELKPLKTLSNDESNFITVPLENVYNFKNINYRDLNTVLADVNHSLPDSIMCVFYTSGSTGEPKGVEIYHKGITNRFFWMNDYFNLPTKNVLKTTRNIFDSSIWQLLWPLINGGKTVLGVEKNSYDLHIIFKLIENHQITTIDFSPSLFQLFVETISTNALSLNIDSLKDIIIGGEAINVSDVNKFKNNYPDIRITNLYGPTEASIGCVFYTLNKSSYNTIPIGIPIANTQIYILDNNLQVVPLGVIGELHIAGVCLAKGYLNRPELTAQKFINDPFCKETTSRMYRTGDLGRWLPDGNIEYLGRKDDQIKIRGYRIEPAEIENVLRGSDMVKHAVVLAWEDNKRNKRLVGYLVMSPGKVFDQEAIFAYLRSRLPEYMVPNLFVELEDIPLTSSGKIDKKSLPDPTVSKPLANPFVAPSNEMEVKLLTIWQQLLEVEKAGTNDNFFQLGGHSLLAMRVISVIRKELQAELSIKELFTYPTVSMLAAYLQRQGNGILLPTVVRYPRPRHIPLSFSQEGLWFIDQLEGSINYHLPLILRFKGNLNRDALIYALQNIINRHEVLRTLIKDEDGIGYQYIQEGAVFQLHSIDGAKYKEDKDGENYCIRNAVNKPFDLSKDTMLRAQLIDFSNEEYVLILTMHHIASDGWSLPTFVKELRELYSSYIEGRPSLLLPLHIQYADYAIWQRQYLQGEALDKNLDYWRKKLEGLSLLELPTDYRRSGRRHTQGAIVGFTIHKEQVEQLESLNIEQGTTLFMTAFAAFNVLLHRYSNQNDICVGSVIAGRQHQELEDLIGLFVNTLALRVKVTSDTSFTELLQQVRTTTLEAYEYQEVPFEKVVEVTVKERDPKRNPLFQIMFVWHNTPDLPELRLGEMEVSREPFTSGTAKFDITFTITETPSGLEGVIEYRTDLYRSSTIERMIGHFKELLSSIVNAPQQKIGELAMLTKEEDKQLLSEFNEELVSYPKEKTIVDLFEEQVVKAPHSLAVVFAEEQLTYATLNKRANQLAHYLKSKNVNAQSPVAICVERSPEMIIGILGILKAGGTYVPIDPTYPQARINYILEDTQAEIVLSSQKSLSKSDICPGAEMIELDIDWPVITTQPTENLRIDIRPNDMAYIIYTSGSTGKPKGVMVEHGNVVSLVKKVDYISLTDEDILLSTASLSFDLTTFEYWGILLNGGQLILCPEKNLLDSELLKKEIKKRKVTKMWFTSSWLNQLVETDINIFCGLDTILVGGEKLSEQHIKKIRTAYPFLKIINGYGPTENTTFSSSYNITEVDDNNSIPIGRSINNRTIYILSEKQKLVPVGVIGEICVGGAGLARGYLNRPDLTKEKFIKNPFDSKKESRLYRTGDLGRWLVDGTIEYLGRLDDQVKIRGYRIELGEIESILQQCGMVRQGLVLAKDDKHGNKRLLGYVVAEGLFDRESITNYLKSKLPDYMIPSQLVQLESLPLTTNGKIDRRALPDPDVSKLDNRYVAPRNEVERIMSEIWAEVLKVEKVGIHDNFFELGGHSLMILKLVNQVRKMGVRVDVKDFFDYQTIDQQSNFIKTTLKLFDAAREGRFVIPIQALGTNDPLFAFPEFLLYSEIGKHISENQPFYSIEHSPFKTVAEIADHYISEIKKLYPVGPYHLAGYCQWGKIAVEMAHKLTAQGDEVSTLVLFEYYSPKIQLSRLSMKFIRDKTKFIINKLKGRISFVDKGRFLSKEFICALKYVNCKIGTRGLKNPGSINKSFSGNVILFQASETYGVRDDSHMGWREVFTGEVKKFTIDGEHLNMMVHPVAAKQIAEILNASLLKKGTEANQFEIEPFKKGDKK